MEKGWDQNEIHFIASYISESTVYHVLAKLPQLHLTLCDSMDLSLSGPYVLGIFQARILQ